MTAPNRRWLQWSLRTLLVVVTVIACCLSYATNWARQRQRALGRYVPLAQSSAGLQPDRGPEISAPLPLLPLGEAGIANLRVIFILAGANESREQLSSDEQRFVAAASRLFPEAAVEIVRISESRIMY